MLSLCLCIWLPHHLRLVFCSPLVIYSLIPVNTSLSTWTGKASTIGKDVCRKTCTQKGANLLTLTSDKDWKNIVHLPAYQSKKYYTKIVVTEGVEYLKNGSSFFVSSPGGMTITFLNVTGRTLKPRSNAKNGTFCIVIYYSNYYSATCNVYDDNVCACKYGEYQFYCIVLVAF